MMKQELLRFLFRRELFLEETIEELFKSKRRPLPADKADCIVRIINNKIVIYTSELETIKSIITQYLQP